MARSAPYSQTDKTSEKEFTEGWTFTAIYAFVDIQVDSISDSAEYIGMECPTQPDRQNQGERISREVELRGYYVFLYIQVDSISDSAEYIIYIYTYIYIY